MPVPNIDAALKAGLSPADIMASLSSKYPTLAPRMSAAEAAGHSPTSILTSLATAPASVFQEGSDGFGAAAETGLGNAVSGLANVAGDAAGAVGLPGIAKSLRADSAGLQNAGRFSGTPVTNLGGDIGNLVRGKNVLRSIENGGASLANLAALQAPTLTTALGLGAATGGAGTAAYLGTNAAGNTIQQRMDAQGENAPSAEDYAAGGLNGVVQGALGTVGLGGVGAAAIPGLAAKSALLRGATKIGLDAATSGLGSVGSQLADTAGTPGGPRVSLGDVEGAAAQGAAGRAVTLGLPDQAIKTLSGNPPPPNVLDADRLASVGSMIDEAKSKIGGSGGASHTAAVNSVFHNLDGELRTAAGNLVDQGYMTKAQKQNIFDPLMNQSGSHKNVLGEVSDGTNPGQSMSALDKFMKIGMPSDIAAPVVNALRDREILSQNKTYKQMTGPLAAFGHRIGEGVGLVATGLAPEFPGKGVAAEYLGSRAGGWVGRKIGAAGDNLFGLNRPPIVKEAQVANKALAKAGVTPSPSSILQLQQLNDALENHATNTAPVATPGSVPAQANQLSTIKQLAHLIHSVV